MGIFCGVSCSRKFRKRQSRYHYHKKPTFIIGEEKKQPCSWHEKEWYIRTGVGFRGWERKAKIVIEKAIGRSLRKEEQPIIFIDGDRLNCSLDNLAVYSTRVLDACDSCGRQRSTTARQILKKKTGLCVRCSVKSNGLRAHRLRRGENVRSECDIAAIKSLLRPSRLVHHGMVAVDSRHVSDSQIARWFNVTNSLVCLVRKGHYSYREIEPMAKKEVWKALLKQHSKLKSSAAGTTFDRVTLLKQVYEDEHYLAAMKSAGESPTKGLDKRLSDTCANFTELLQILKMFPKKSQWTKGDLGEMRLKMLEKLRALSPKSAKKKGGRTTVTLAEMRKLEEENARLKAEIKMLTKEVKSLRMDRDSDRDVISALRQSISHLEPALA